MGQVKGWLAGRDPNANVPLAEMIRRWPSGTRIVVHPVAAAAGVLLTAFGVASAVSRSGAPTWLSAVVGILVALLSGALVAWFVPMGTVQVATLDTVADGDSVALTGTTGFQVFVSASPVVYGGVTTTATGTRVGVIGLKDGTTRQGADHATVILVHFVDLFEAFRAPSQVPHDIDAPIVEICDAVANRQSRIGRTNRWSTRREEVVAALDAAGITTEDATAAIGVASGLGLITDGPQQISFTNSGATWHRMVHESEALETQPNGELATAHDIRVIVQEQFERRAMAPAIHPDQFVDWLDELLQDFKFLIENTMAVRGLWRPDGQPQGERAAQALVFTACHQACKQSNVAMNPESNFGDGPVDFEFSNGWHARALVDVKLMRNTHLTHGAALQFPRYLTTGMVQSGFLVCIGFTAEEISLERRHEVAGLCRTASAEYGLRIRPVFIDARRRPSASKIPNVETC